jgi:hypothetical protein
VTSLFEEEDASGAELSPCGVYRYVLTREWEDGQSVTFLMFNPSTADATEDDPTIRKCVGFAKRWGYGRMNVVNLFAVRSRDPKAVGRMATGSAVGPLNNFWIVEAAKESREVICSWGCAQHLPGINRRIAEVLALLEEKRFSMPLNCLGYRLDKHPRHPLMLAYDTPREQFFWREA